MEKYSAESLNQAKVTESMDVTEMYFSFYETVVLRSLRVHAADRLQSSSYKMFWGSPESVSLDGAAQMVAG